MTRALRRRALPRPATLLALAALLLAVSRPATAQSPALLEARGDSLAAAGTAEARRAAIERWEAAAGGYEAAGEPRAAAAVLLRIGAAERVLGRPDAALASHRRALALVEGRDVLLEARALNAIGVAFYARARADSARAYGERALRRLGSAEAPGERADILHGLANVFLTTGAPDSALALYRRALPLRRAASDLAGEGATLNNLALAHKNLGRRDSALVYQRHARTARRAAGDRAGEAGSLTNLGLIFVDVGRPDSALHYHALALALARETGDRRAEAATLTNIGIVQHLLGRPDSALVYFRADLALSQAGSDLQGWIRGLSNVATVQEQLGRRDSALAAHRLILGLRERLGDRSGTGTTLTGLGEIHLRAGRADSARARFGDALVIHESLGDRSREAGAHQNLARALLQLGEPDGAAAHLRRTVAILADIEDVLGEGLARAALARALRPLQGAAAAAAQFDTATALLARVAAHAGGDAARVSFEDVHVDVFADWALAVAAGHGEDVDGTGALAALAAVERGRARGLLTLLGEPPPPAGTLEEEGMHAARGLRRGATAALVYQAGPDTLLAWAVLPSGEAVLERVAVPRDSLARLVDAFRAALEVDRPAPALRDGAGDGFRLENAAARAPGNTADAGAALAALLLPPRLRDLLPDSGEVVIVPSGVLGALPYAALPVEGGRLGERRALRFAPSLAVLAAVERGAGAGASGSILVVGNPAMPSVLGVGGESAVLAPLPHAESEALWLAERLGVGALVGEAAGEAEVRRRMPGARLIHLATHGYAYGSADRAGASFVALAPGDGHDGLLTVGELMTEVPRLSAELVVLSACQTGMGTLRRAEGTVGLQRALLARGAHTVLVSLWSVSDRATSELMRAFYRHWLEDTDRPAKAEALRRAQEDVRGLPGLASPRHWAAFQLVGAR